MTGHRLARSAGLIGIATLTSRILGLIREVIQGHYFATSNAADAFGVATRIPNLLRELFAEGAMSAALVPTLARYHESAGRAAAWRLGAQVINALVLVTGTLVILGIVFAEPLVRLYAGAFASPEYGDKFSLTVRLSRFNMPFLLLVAVAAVFMGMLNSVRRFFIPAMSPALSNLAFILCTVVLVPRFTSAGIEPVMALSVAMLLGGFTQLAAQWPSLRREGYQHHWTLDPRDPGLRTVLVLMGPGTLGVAAAQINLLVNTSLATGEQGAVSALGYAFRLMQMPIGIFGVSVATAAIPDLARHAAQRASAGMRATLSAGVRLMLMLSVPGAVGLMVLASPIVELIFQHGAFTASDTQKVAGALLFYAPGIVGYSLVKIASPSFYALEDARTPAVISAIAIITNLVLNLWLNAVMGFRGLALGTSVAANINAALLLVFLSRRIDGVDARRIFVSFGKIAVASLAMGLAAYWTEARLHATFPDDALPARLVRVGGGIGAGVVVLAVSAWVLRIDEFRQAIRRVADRL
jgi:putative peptidoglycan lipid II flippase